MTAARNVRLISGALASCISASCALLDKGPPFEIISSVPSDKATVYLYRPDIFRGGGITPPVYLDREMVFELESGGYAVMQMVPGNHVIETRKGSFLTSAAVGEIQIEVEAGKEYFVRWLPYITDFGIVAPVAYALFEGTFHVIDKDAALSEISECHRVYPLD